MSIFFAKTTATALFTLEYCDSSADYTVRVSPKWVSVLSASQLSRFKRWLALYPAIAAGAWWNDCAWTDDQRPPAIYTVVYKAMNLEYTALLIERLEVPKDETSAIADLGTLSWICMALMQ